MVVSKTIYFHPDPSIIIGPGMVSHQPEKPTTIPETNSEFTPEKSVVVWETILSYFNPYASFREGRWWLWITLQKTHMSMENPPFEDVFPVESWWKVAIFQCHVSFR